ncbi:hypothetical protein DL546_003554 [Coniochaeta pulveracea]|uniref:Glycosyltransferase family 31 protein n=1 Tax=Coniochaeta pulveracea TaxID=177199 RepID=A0A420YDS8_9PEZI|nr:hypothetical protein DL546_003554 [Coniochaeta pulveracea]
MQLKLGPQRLSWLPPRFSRLLPTLVASIVFVLLVTTARLRNGSFSSVFRSPPPPKIEPPKPIRPPLVRLPLSSGQCTSDIEYLRQRNLDLSNSITYSRRCVKQLATDKFNRDDVVNISKPLITHKTAINLTDCTVPDPIPCDDLPLQVPFPYPAQQYKHLIFGIASTYDRINDSLPAFAHWLKNTNALLVGVVVDAEEEKEGQWHPNPNVDLPALERLYNKSGVTASFIAPALKVNPRNREPEKRTEHHHFMLIRDLLARSTNETRWLGILDDDTFFPSLYPLDQELRRHDHARPLWLGALSEAFSSVQSWGYMAYGGAGAFVSLPLAREMNPVLEECIADATVDTGDGIMRDCVYTRTHTKLTLVPGLYQHDTHGDMSGFYESGVRPLSVHHWKTWYHEPMPEIAAVTDLCGDCFLARWRFGNDTLFTNGYSIATYAPGVLERTDLSSMEGTWVRPGRDFDFSLAPLREPLARDKKKSYHLKDSGMTETGTFRQLYVYRGDEEKEENDEVVELIWDLQ